MDLPSFFRLDGRTAFISAARGHLGAAMARALAGVGAHVIVNGRDDAKLADFERQLRAEEHSGRTRRLRRCRYRRRPRFGGRERLDILVNNAVSMQVKSFAALGRRLRRHL